MNEEKEYQIISNSEFLEFFPAGIIIFDDEGNIIRYNQNLFAFNIIDSNREDIERVKIYELSIIKENSLVDKINLLSVGELFEEKLKSFKTISGSEIEIIIKASPVFIDGEYKGGILIVEDMQIDSVMEQPKQIEIIENILKSRNSFFIVCLPDKKIKIKSKQISENQLLESCNSLEEFVEKIRIEKETFLNSFDLVCKNKTTVSIDSIAFIADSEFLFRISIIPNLNNKNLLESVIILFVDITEEAEEKKNLEKHIFELQKFHEFTSKVLDAIINLDSEGNIIYWSENAENLFELSRSEVYGKFIGKVFPQLENSFDEFLKEIKTSEIWRGEFSIDLKNTNKVILLQASIVQETDPLHVVIVCTDISQKSKFEKEIKASEEKFRNIVINTQEYIFTFDTNGKLQYANPYFLQKFGYTEEDIKNIELYNLVAEEYQNLFDFTKPDGIQLEKNSIELELVKRDSSRVYVFGNITTIKELDGSVKYCNAVFNDISEKKETEKNLLLIKSVFEASNDGIAIQYKRKYVLVNDRFVEMFGYDNNNEIIGKDPLDFVAPEDYVKIANQITANENQISDKKKIEFTGVKKDGTKFLVEKTASTYKTKDGVYIVSTLRDITKDREILRTLEQSETRFRNILENIDDCLWSSAKVGKKFEEVFYSRAIQKITGFPPELFLADSRFWIKIIHPDDAEKVISELRKFYKDERKGNFEIEYRIINNLGSTVWIRNKIFVLRDNYGSIEKIFGLVSDITLRKRAEDNLKKSTEELKIINSTKDKFISIISHDLRTPFSSILGFTDVLLNEEDLTVTKQKQYISMIQESARNMLSLVNSLLDWTRIQTGRINFAPKRTNAIEIVNKAVNMLSGAAFQKNINLAVRIFDDFYIHADENLLLQVFTNLISNAIKFTKIGGTISINAKPHSRSRFIQFSVKDNGVGIRSEDLSKLFKIDAKFSTLGTSGERGSGLGLTLVKEIINKHGGEITVESEFGKGSEFIFTIPTSSISVLLVDNSTTDRVLYSKIIRNFIPNYSIIETDNGKEAYEFVLSMFPALVIMENKLVDMSGLELSKKIILSEEVYKPPIIILGRNVSDNDISDYHQLGVNFAFKKPVNLNAFKLAIEKSLRREVVN